MTSFSDTRTAQPSTAQVEALVTFLESRPDLARGFGKNKTHRERAHKDWFRIGLKLNNMPGGAVKTTQRWIKYWSDKKSSLKKKAAVIENQNEDEGDAPELSEIEERILALLRASANASSVSNRRLKKEPVDQQQESSRDNMAATYLLEDEMGDDHDIQEDTTNDEADDTLLSEYRFNDANQSKHKQEDSHTRHVRAVPSSRWGRLKLPPKPDPPQSSQTNFCLVADKLCRLEQQRLELDRRMVTVIERNSERDHMLVEAVKAMGEGLKALAEAIAKN